MECKAPRKIDRSKVEDVPGEVAWEEMKHAIQSRDLDDVKIAAEKYMKACPEATYQQLQHGFRVQGLNAYLIALEKELNPTYTNMDLQGNLDRKYSVTWRSSDKPLRPKESEGWPASLDENYARLADAGEPVDRGVPKCNNCDQ